MGGVWDMANLDQSPNPQQLARCTPPRKGGIPPKHENGFFFGMAMRFSHVEELTVKGLTIRNPTSYGLALCRTSCFLVDDLAFDYTTCNPIFLNMDGVHLDGWCHHGKISNLRGTCFDDIVIRDAFAAKALSPENIGTHSRTNYPLVWVEGAVDVGRLTVEGFSRDEKTVPVATLRVDSAATVRTLTVRDCKMSNALDAPVSFLEAKGTVGKVTVENVDFAGRWTQTGDR